MNENNGQGTSILGCRQCQNLSFYRHRELNNTNKKETYRRYLELTNLEFEQSALPRADQRLLFQSIFAARKISNREDKKRATRNKMGTISVVLH